MSDPLSAPRGSATSAITLLAVAGFAAQAMVRVTDSLLPQIAADLNTTVGAASIVVTVYLLAHGSVQLVIGPIGDRFGKYKCVSIAAAVSTTMVFACGLAPTLPLLVAARLGSGLATGWIIPFALAFVGDVIPYERRQQVIGTFLSGQILGQMFGQAAGGVLGDYFGWRNVFFILAAMLAVATLGLFYELWRNPITHASGTPAQRSRGFVADYSTVLRTPWARMVIAMAFLEFATMFGAFTYVGADLHLRFGLNFTFVGLFVGTFAIGGLIYSLSVSRLVRQFGQAGLAVLRRRFAGGGLCDAGVRADGLDRACGDHRDRARLLYAAQHHADQRHADGAGSARHRGRDLLRFALSRTDGRRRRWRRDLRPLHRGAGVLDRGGNLAGARPVVLKAAQAKSVTSGWVAAFAGTSGKLKAGRARRVRSRRARSARPGLADCRRASL